MIMTPFARVPILLALLGLAACASVGPDYIPPTPDLPAAWNRLSDATNASTAKDLAQWWRNLNDPLLSELVEEALRTSPNLRAAQARLREARLRRAMAVADFAPSVSASGGASRGQSSRETGSGLIRETYSAGFDASWEVDVFGGTRRGVEAADADLQSSQASLQETRVSLVAEVALNYVEVRLLQQRLGIARSNLSSQSETYQLTDWRAQAGLASIQDVEQARGSMEQTRAQIPSLETSLAEAEHRLDVLLGKNPGTLRARLATQGPLPAVPARMAVGIPADALRQRPDIQAADRTLAAETARVGVAQAARYPSFNLSGSIGLEALALHALGASGAGTSSLLAGITVPIFDAGKLRNQVEIQDAAREQALVAYEQAVLNALQDVENALVALARSSQRIQALESATDAARNAARLARQRYSTGLIDFQPVLETERNVLSVEDSLASTRADEVLALIRLYKALGGGWSPQASPPSDDKDTP